MAPIKKTNAGIDVVSFPQNNEEAPVAKDYITIKFKAIATPPISLAVAFVFDFGGSFGVTNSSVFD